MISFLSKSIQGFNGVIRQGAAGLVAHRETITRQCQQDVLFDRLELLPHLLLCRSVNLRVGNPWPLFARLADSGSSDAARTH